MKYRVTKRWDHVASVAFRQHDAKSHCRFLHGYGIDVEISFESDTLVNNWVIDFGSLKSLKTTIELLFDHRVLIAGDDPYLDQFKRLRSLGVCQLFIARSVSIERIAEVIWNHAWSIVEHTRNDHILAIEVTVYEHSGNSARFSGNRLYTSTLENTEL